MIKRTRSIFIVLSVLFSAIFSLVAKPVPLDVGEKVHIGVHGKFAPILHQVDESTSVELHWVTQDNYLYDAIGSPVAPKSENFKGTDKPWTKGATPNSKYDHLDTNGKVKQTAHYDDNGDVVGHVDWKNHGKEAKSGHGHTFPEPGNPGSGHGKGKPHIPNSDLPGDWQNPSSGLPPQTPIGQ